MDPNNKEELFKKSFRGYDVSEVDEYVENAAKDMDSLRREMADLYKKLADANSEIEKYRRENAERGDIINKAKAEADAIVKEAREKAESTILHTSRQCSRIVADSAAEVGEQKKAYESAKREVLKFRSDLFAMYKEHVIKINEYSKAAGAFDEDADGGGGPPVPVHALPALLPRSEHGHRREGARKVRPDLYGGHRRRV